MSDLLGLLIEASPLGCQTGPDQRKRGSLGNNGNKSSPSRSDRALDTARITRRWARRRERHDLRHKLRGLTEIPRIGKCGWVTVGPGGSGEGGPGLRVSPDPRGAGTIAGFSGLATCSSVWACPVCSATIATRRADDLAALMKVALERDCSATLVTLTMRHHEGQRLSDCWDALAKAWAAVTSGKQWTDDQKRYQLRGWVKAVEVTKGKSGWHVHLHALMIWDGPVNMLGARRVADRMWTRWDRALHRQCSCGHPATKHDDGQACSGAGCRCQLFRGFDSLRDLGGLDVRLASLVPGERGGLHEYFVKLAHEITGGSAKLAKGNGRTPFQILSSVFETGEAADVRAWHEWEQSSSGRRQIAYSQGLREWAELGAELTDEELTADDLEGDDMLFIAPDSWRALRANPAGVCDLLEETEGGGYPAARRWLTARGLLFAMLKQAVSGLKRGSP